MPNHERIQQRPFKEQLLDRGIMVVLEHERLNQLDLYAFYMGKA